MLRATQAEKRPESEINAALPANQATDMEPIEEEGTLTREERNRSMKYSTADGMAYSLMTGLGDAYIPAAAISLGATNFYIGLLAALPQLFGAFLQFFSLSILRFFRDRKLIVVAGSLVHAACWICVAAVMLWPGPLSIELIAVFFTLGTGCSLLINPAWSSWISDIVPENERAGFFAGRNRLMQLMLFAATFTAGIVLNQLQLAYPAAIAFGMIFTVAATARLASTFFLTQMNNIKYEIQLMREIQLKHLFMLPAHRHELWFLAFVALLTFSVQFASPFFTPYMLNELHFTLEALGIVTATSVLAKILSYPYWGKIIDRFGNRTVLITAAFLSPLGSVLWLFSKDLPMLLLFNIVSGFIWSGYEIAVFNYALSMVGRELRPSFISKYNIFVNVFYACGAVAGGLFLMGFGNAMLFGFSGFLLVFLISGVMRIVVALAFTPKLTSGREVLNTSQERAMVFDLVAVYPTQGAVSHVLTGWNFTRKAVSTTTERGGRIMKEGLGATGELLIEGGRKIMSKVSRRKHL